MPNIVVPATEVVLPHYVRAHWSPTDQRYTYRWEVNGEIKRAGFKPTRKLFGTDLALAIRVAQDELLCDRGSRQRWQRLGRCPYRRISARRQLPVPEEADQAFIPPNPQGWRQPHLPVRDP